MKNILLIALLFSLTSYSQVWIDSNATWHYKVLSQNNPGHYEYHYDEDTLLLGQLCQKITGQRTLWYWNSSDWDVFSTTTLNEKYTYVNGDTVFHFFNDQFFILYNFGANIGDQWLLADTNLYDPSTNCYDSAFVEVIDTGSMIINSTSYRTITLQTLDSSSYALNGLFVERFGFIPDSSRWRMTPIAQSCDPSFVIQPWYVDFSCFEDNSFTLYNPSGDDCVYAPSTANLTSIEKPLFEIYPNPASTHVQLSGTQNCSVDIFSITGQKMMSLNLEKHGIVDLSNFSNGTYYFVFSREDTFLDVIPVNVTK